MMERVTISNPLAVAILHIWCYHFMVKNSSKVCKENFDSENPNSLKQLPVLGLDPSWLLKKHADKNLPWIPLS